MAELADANALCIEIIKLNLFQEVEKIGRIHLELSIPICRSCGVQVPPFPPKYLWERSSMVERRY